MRRSHYWGCLPCSYPDRSGDRRSVTRISDFYSTRQWRATGIYQVSSRGPPLPALFMARTPRRCRLREWSWRLPPVRKTICPPVNLGRTPERSAR